MRILADENIDAPIVAWLRSEGHDVTAVSEMAPGTDDASILPIAVEQKRVVMTFDSDFGELVIRRRLPVPGVILLRLRTRDPNMLLEFMRTTWATISRFAVGHFVVVTAGNVRIRPLPPIDVKS